MWWNNFIDWISVIRFLGMSISENQVLTFLPRLLILWWSNINYRIFSSSSIYSTSLQTHRHIGTHIQTHILRAKTPSSHQLAWNTISLYWKLINVAWKRRLYYNLYGVENSLIGFYKLHYIHYLFVSKQFRKHSHFKNISPVYNTFSSPFYDDCKPPYTNALYGASQLILFVVTKSRFHFLPSHSHCKRNRWLIYMRKHSLRISGKKILPLIDSKLALI